MKLLTLKNFLIKNIAEICTKKVSKTKLSLNSLKKLKFSKAAQRVRP